MRAGRSRELRLGVGLDGGAGWHPAAWRSEHVDASRLFTAGYVAEQVRLAESGGLDLVTMHDAFGLQPGGAERFRGRLDPVLTLAAVAPLTHSIGLVAGHRHDPHRAVPRRQEHRHPRPRQRRAGRMVADGRPPARPRPTCSAASRPAPPPSCTPRRPTSSRSSRRLWDSWEDDAVIRDVADRPLRRPRQAPLRRLRRPVLQRAGPVDHAPVAAGPAARRRRRHHAGGRWPWRRAQADVSSSRPPTSRRRAPRATTCAARSSAAGRDPDDVTVLATVDVAARRRPPRARSPSRPGSTALAGPSSPPTRRRRSPAPAPAWPTCSTTWFRSGRGRRRSLVRPRVPRSTLAQLVDRTSCPPCAAAACSAPPERASCCAHRFGLDRPANRYAAAAGRA